MRKHIIFVLCLALAAISIGVYSFANEEAKGKEVVCKDKAKKWAENAKEKLEDLTVKLNLTAEQQAQVKEILTKSKEESKAVREEAKGKIKEIRSRAHDEIAALLTAEQKEKFKDVRKECETSQKPADQE